MPSLRQILSAHAPLLLLDAASSRIQAGMWDGSGPARWSGSAEEAGIGIFRCLDSLGVDPARMGAFAFAEGPGSVLGIRLSAVALRMWCALIPRPVFAYHALALLAEAADHPELTFIADARREEWHCCRRGRVPWRQPAAGLAAPLATPEGFRHWTPLPPGVENVPYRVDELLDRAGGADLFRPVAEPDAFLPEPPNYATWSPQIHRAARTQLPP